jgi:hypothetical protein
MASINCWKPASFFKNIEQFSIVRVSYTGDWDRVEEPDFLVVFLVRLFFYAQMRSG